MKKSRHTAQSAFFNLFPRICLAVVCAGAMSAHANIITVTNANDSGPGSLRQALADANDGDTINFAVTGTIGLTSGELLVENSVTISGPGSENLAVDANATSRVMHIAPGKVVTISDLTITNGYAGSQPVLDGAGIYNDHATLSLGNCTINNNFAARNGGGVYNAGAATMMLNGCVINGNMTGNDGGGINNVAGLTISNSTFTGNSANFGGNIASGGATVSIGDTVLKAGKAGGNILMTAVP